ncbi:hypothetical protein K439DRAFT_1364574, partial [Ramaria rubella]
FYCDTYKYLCHGAATMDVLVILGTSVVFVYSVLAMACTLRTCNPYYHPTDLFNTYTMFNISLSLGCYQVNFVKSETSAVLTNLKILMPQWQPDSKCTQEKHVAMKLIQVSGTVKLIPSGKKLQVNLF